MRLVYLAIGWTLGIVLAASFSALTPIFWLILLGISGWLAMSMRDSRWPWLFFAFLAFSCAGFRYQIVPQSSEIAQYNLIGNATIEGIVVAEPDIRDDRILLRVEAERIIFGAEEAETSGLVLVTVQRSIPVAYGDRLLLTGGMGIPAEYDTFSYADYLARQGIFSLMSNASVEILGHGEGIAFYHQLFAIKQHLQDLIAQALPEPQAALLTGILLGNERGIDRDLADAFSRVGAAHVIAISGYNMALIADIIAKLFRPLKRERLSVFLGILVLALYTLLVGANAAVVRAALMSSLLVIAPLFKRRTYVPASLAFVALLLSLENPLILWDISFQLSFFAVLGLALFAKPLERQFDKLLHFVFPRRIVPTLSSLLNGALVTSLAALSLTLPLIILYFQRVSLVVFAVNFLILPVQSWILILGGLALIVAIVLMPLAQMLFWLEMLLLSWTIAIVRIFAALPYAETSVSLDYRLIWFSIFFVMGVAMVNATRASWAQGFARMLRRRPIFNSLVFLALGIAALMLLIRLSRADGMLHVWWFDVGHSNAVFITTPSGAQILVDGGRFPSRLLTAIGDRMPFYDRTIEIMVMSQPDEWDVSAQTAVLNRYHVPIVLTNGQPNQGDAILALEAAMANSEIVVAQAGYEIIWGDGTRIEVLHPQSQPDLNNNLNDGALVLRLSYGERSFLLSSDLSIEGQRALLESGVWPLADVMQLPQHGAARSLDEDFLLAVQPQVIVLQSEQGVRREEPHPDTLARLEGIPVYKTDEMGTLHFWTNGEQLWMVGTK